MFKLIKMNDDLYSIVGKGIHFEGTLKYIVRQMLKLSIHEEEIEEGVKAIQNHDYAEYGILGRFIFSRNFNE